jgi:hypothetical protein
MKRIVFAVLAVVALGSTGCAAQGSDLHADRPMCAGAVTLRATAGSIWTSANAFSEVHRAWSMPAHGPVESVEVKALAAGGYTVSFVQGGVAWCGQLDASRRPTSSLRPDVARFGGAAIASR